MFLLAIACAPEPDTLVFQDSLADAALFGSPAEPISSPYVAGSAFRIEVTHSRRADLSGWSPRSSEPWTLAVDDWSVSGQTMTVWVTAANPGTAELRVADDAGMDQGALSVQVSHPTHVELLSHGAQRAGQPDLQPGDAFQVLQDGSASLAIQYMDGDQVLSGFEALSVRADDALGADVRLTWPVLGQQDEYVQIAPTETGEFALDLIVDDTVVDTLSVTVVSQDTLVTVDVVGLDAEQTAQDGDDLALLAVARDTDGDAVLGGPDVWSQGTEPLLGATEVLFYRFEPGATTTVRAAAGPSEQRASIQGVPFGSDDSPESQPSLSCNGVPVAPAFWGSLFALGLALVRRRDRA